MKILARGFPLGMLLTHDKNLICVLNENVMGSNKTIIYGEDKKMVVVQDEVLISDKCNDPSTEKVASIYSCSLGYEEDKVTIYNKFNFL